jgi:uncharacterized protein YacL
MLILLLRIAFVVLAVLIGVTNGQYFYRGVMDGRMPPWFGGALGFGIAITLIAADQAFRRRFARSVVAFLIGLGCGLAMAWLLLQVLILVIQDADLYRNLDLPLALVTIYLVMMTVLRNIDRWRVVIPFVEFRSERYEGGSMVLDAAILGDSRLPALFKTGLFANRLILHRRVLSKIEEMSRSSETGEQRRAARALEGLKDLRALGTPRVDIDETEVPNASTLDDLLVGLCRLESATLLGGDRELLRLAEAEGVAVADLSALASLLAPTVKPGEIIAVRVDKPGEGKDQGVGFLDDGSMVVVNGAADRAGTTVRATVLRIHTTANGRMVFCEITH